MAFNIIQQAVRITFAAGILLTMQGCAHHCSVSHSVPVMNGDVIRLLSFDEIGAPSLTPGKQARFSVRVQYTLTTYDRAVLSIDLIQFANRDSCATDAGQIVQSAHFAVQIERGSHEIETTMTWPGDQVHSPQTGAVSVQTSMGLAQPAYQFLTRLYGTQYCLRFQGAESLPS